MYILLENLNSFKIEYSFKIKAQLSTQSGCMNATILMDNNLNHNSHHGLALEQVKRPLNQTEN